MKMILLRLEASTSLIFVDNYIYRQLISTMTLRRHYKLTGNGVDYNQPPLLICSTLPIMFFSLLKASKQFRYTTTIKSNVRKFKTKQKLISN